MMNYLDTDNGISQHMITHTASHTYSPPPLSNIDLANEVEFFGYYNPADKHSFPKGMGYDHYSHDYAKGLHSSYGDSVYPVKSYYQADEKLTNPTKVPMITLPGGGNYARDLDNGSHFSGGNGAPNFGGFPGKKGGAFLYGDGNGGGVYGGTMAAEVEVVTKVVVMVVAVVMVVVVAVMVRRL
jgi:hypothetical protein